MFLFQDQIHKKLNEEIIERDDYHHVYLQLNFDDVYELMMMMMVHLDKNFYIVC